MDFLRYILYDLGFVCFLTLFFSMIILIGLKLTSNLKKKICFSFSAIPIALVIFELFTSLKTGSTNVNLSGSYNDNDTVTGEKQFLGYGPKEDTTFQVSLIKKENESLIFDVTYSFKNGLRTVSNNDTSNYHISLLGGSHIFGEGLNDNQTIAYYLNYFSDKSYNISNYGFNGYGTHQALNSIERSKEEDSVVIYYFITEHINRAAGKSIWDKNGPCYEFKNNKLIYTGSFNQSKLFQENYISKRINIIWENSHIYKTFFANRYSEKNIFRVKEMIKKMNVISKDSNTRFIVLIKKETTIGLTKKLEKYLFDPLKNSNIECYFTNEIIKNLDTNPSDYRILGDGHPNENHNKKIAEFLYNKISKK